MRSEEKIDVRVERMPNYGNKLWMRILIKNGKNELVPSFEDWFRMIRGLMECEKDKYNFSYDPYKVPREFFMDCFNDKLTWEEIKVKHKIPTRI
jgi:hypothetical protein